MTDLKTAYRAATYVGRNPTHNELLARAYRYQSRPPGTVAVGAVGE